jgi:carbamoyl-phosphate synthase large subunit
LKLDRALENRYSHNIKYEHVYLDFDDLVIFEGKINTAVMAFVFQCINKGVKVHLLTRHRGDLTASLTKYRLNNLFDDTVLLSDSQEKTDSITEADSIFIDDSFVERKKVHETKQIPVFDSHMLEALMERS